MATKLMNEARINPNDLFYTRLEDIEDELKHYKKYFKDKVIFCNCDDPYESNFFKYFALNFNSFGIKKLICTCYDGSPVAGEQLSLLDVEELNPEKEHEAYKVELTEVVDYNHDGQIDLSDVEQLLKRRKSIVTLLKGNGDFESDECVELLKSSDICITNPPFSKFKEWLNLTTKYNKDFIIIGNTNALSYRDVFKLFKADRMRTGYTNFNKGMYFRVPESFEKYTKIIGGVKYARVSTSCWFTSLPVRKHLEDLILSKQYKGNEKDYYKYDNYDAINIKTFNDIPYDYDGVMGVPITFLDKLNPNQFELIGLCSGDAGQELGISANFTDEMCKEYHRKNSAFRRGFVCYTDESGNVIVPYMRILIRRK